MSVIRVNKTENYTVMSNYHLQDRTLPLKAKGLLSQMLSLPPEWDYTVEGLAALNVEKVSAISTALRDLKDAGYLVVTKLMPGQTKSGRIEYVYDIYEVPGEGKQEAKKQGVEIQGVELQGIENQGVGFLCLENQGIENQGIENIGLNRSICLDEIRNSYF